MALALACGGCGPAGGVPKGPSSDDPDAVEVTGSVQLDGVPLADGAIAFDAADGRPPVVGKIVNGSYRARMAPGAKAVRVNRYKEAGRKDPYGQPVRVSDIPPRYNTATKLTAAVQAGRPNRIDFPLTSR